MEVVADNDDKDTELVLLVVKAELVLILLDDGNVSMDAVPVVDTKIPVTVSVVHGSVIAVVTVILFAGIVDVDASPTGKVRVVQDRVSVVSDVVSNPDAEEEIPLEIAKLEMIAPVEDSIDAVLDVVKPAKALVEEELTVVTLAEELTEEVLVEEVPVEEGLVEEVLIDEVLIEEVLIEEVLIEEVLIEEVLVEDMESIVLVRLVDAAVGAEDRTLMDDAELTPDKVVDKRELFSGIVPVTCWTTETTSVVVGNVNVNASVVTPVDGNRTDVAMV